MRKRGERGGKDGRGGGTVCESSADISFRRQSTASSFLLL